MTISADDDDDAGDDPGLMAFHLAMIRRLIERGKDSDLEAERRDWARVNHDYYLADFASYDPRDQCETKARGKPKHARTVPVMQRVVDELTKHLYSKGPARAIHDAPDVSQWLAERYARQGADACMQAADQLAIVADVCAIQVRATGDPAEPIGFSLWPAHQFIAFEDPDDPLVPLAVAVIDEFDERRRLRLWTSSVMQTYLTDQFDSTAGGTAYRLDDEIGHDFGVIPFAFVHARRPSTRFWSGGCGGSIRSLNEYLNIGLTQLGDDFHYLGKPITVVCGVGKGWTMPHPIQAGEVIYPPTLGYDADGNGIPPSITNLTPDLGSMEVGWADLQSFLDVSLMALNIPPAAIRMVEVDAKSGVAIVAEQMPVILWAEGRKRPFGDYEKSLARVALAVGRAETGRLDLDPALAAGMQLSWPSLVPEIPLFGQSQDDADGRSLALGVLSRIMIVMRRLNCDRDAALAFLKQVADDLKDEATLGLPALPMIALAPPSAGDPDS